MNKFKSFFALALLCTAALVNADCSNVCANDNAGIRTFVLPRSQGSNTAMELVGWQDFIHQCDTECFYGVADIRFEYTRTFRPERIAEQLFGADVLHFQGINVASRRADSLLADNFGLSPEYNGAICFKPRIDNFVVDFNFYFGLDNWLCGLYFEAHLPIVRTRWTLFDCDSKRNNCNVNATGTAATTNNCAPCPQVQDNIASGGNVAFPANYMSVGDAPCTTATVPAAPDLMTALSGTYTFGDMKTQWAGSRISSCRLSKSRLADLELQLGWDFYKNECSHLGAFLEIVAPTGGAACSQYLFSPVVGNGGHFELGAGMTGHYDVWGCDGHQFSVWMYGFVTHGFNKKSTRTFDFNNGPFTRYNLLNEFNADGTYANNIISGTNFTTRSIETNIRVKGDASFKLAYNYCGWRFDLGYNIYGDSGERCSSKKNCNPSSTGSTTATTVAGCLANSCSSLDASRRFGFKGCTSVAANVVVTATGLCDANFAPNPFVTPTTVSGVTAFSGCSVVNATNPQSIIAPLIPVLDSAVAPFGVDPAVASGSIVDGEFVPNPTLVTLADINVCSGLARSQITNKVFGYLGYDWMDNCYTPFIGFLWEVEFAKNSSRGNNCDTNSSSNCSSNGCNFNGPVVAYAVNSTANGDCSGNSHRGGVSQWGVGFKAGLTF